MNSYLMIEKLVKDFENNQLPPETFHHQEHVKLAWWYLSHNSLLEAIEKFSSGLKRFASLLGKESLYHETITWAYILLINERIQKLNKKLDWDEFANTNKDLLSWGNNILKRYYQENTLSSELARKTFVFPDKPLQSL